MYEIRTDILKDNMWKTMWRLSVPGVIGFFFYGLNNLLDGLFVGMFEGESALAGITFAYPVVQLISGIGILVGMGVANYLSLAIGKKDTQRIRQVFGNTVILSLLSSGIVMFFGLLFSREIILAMGGEGKAVDPGYDYLYAIFLGTPFNLVAIGLNLMLRGEGKMKLAMKLFGLSTLLNALLTPVFIHYLNWGVTGAAWSTNIAFAISCMLHLWYFKKYRATIYEVWKWTPNFRLMNKIIILGMPAALLNVLILFQHYFVIRNIIDIGSNKDIAFFGAINRILMFALLPVYGMSRAFQPVIGITYGAGNKLLSKKAFRVFSASGTATMLVLTAIVFIWGEPFIGFFIPDFHITPTDMLRYYVLMSTLLLLPVMVLSMTFIQAIGKSGTAAILVIMRQLVVFIPVMYAFTSWFGLNGIYFSFLAVDVLLGLTGIFVILKFYLSQKQIQYQIQSH